MQLAVRLVVVLLVTLTSSLVSAQTTSLARGQHPAARDNTAGRVVVETVTSTVLSAGLGALVLFTTTGPCIGDSNRDDGWPAGCGIVSAGSVGVSSLGASFGTWGVGKLMGGRGQFLPTLLGGALGTALGTFGSYAALGDFWIVGAMFAVPVLSTVGSVLGFELFPEREASATQGARRFSLNASAAPTDGGAAMSLSGTF